MFVLAVMTFGAAVSFGATLLGTLLIGIPTTLLLRRSGLESGLAYGLAGATTGGLVPATIVILVHGTPPGMLIMGTLGAASGLAAATTWWRTYRRQATGAID